MRVWVIRHGESETNKNGLWTGWLDAPLTEKGKQEAALANRIVSTANFDKIYSSDLLRAKRTAEIALPGCEYETTALLREINVGTIAGKPLNVVLDSDHRPMNSDGYGRFGGESKDEFRDRILAFMKILESENCENIAVFSHAGVIRKFLDIVLGIELDRKKICCKNCAIAIFEYNNLNWSLYSWINLFEPRSLP